MSQIEELREILVGANAAELAALKQRIEDIESRAADVSEVLGAAIERSDSTDLALSLQKPVSISLKTAIRSEPEEYAEILYPVMAPSIRRAIAQSISSLLITINRTVESATSAKGITTRIESMRTGVPYAELAFRQSLLYRVEHVYLIDRKSGMQVEEITSSDAESLDGDAVSAMFSAIQSFVQDSFSHDGSAMLTDLKVGDHNVWVAHGPSLMLASVIRGDAPEDLKGDLYDTLDKISTNYATPIADFDGDTENFGGVDNIMQPLLQLQIKEGEDEVERGSGAPSLKKSLPFIVAGLILFFIGYYFFAHNNQLSTVAYYLKKTPGIAATDVYWNDGKLVVEGLKDPDASIPYGTFEAYGIAKDVLQFQTIPFRSLEADMEFKRFSGQLVLPSGVYLSLKDGVVHLNGQAPLEWLDSNGTRIQQLAADGRLVLSGLSVSDVSVDEILSLNFEPSIPDTIERSSVTRNGLTILQIDGALEPSELAVMKALFAGNVWVSVMVTPRQNSSPEQKSMRIDRPQG